MPEKQIIRLGLKEKITLEFNEIASSGYLWSVEFPHNSVGIARLTPERARKQRKTHLIGGSANVSFEVSANFRGTFDVTFNHSRPWEEGASPIEQKHYRIIVR